MNTAIPNEVHANVRADPGRPADVPKASNADQSGTPAEDTTPSSQQVTVIGKSRFDDIC